MSPPKELTPHQFSKGLSYVEKVPPFLERLKQKQQDERMSKFKMPDPQDDDDENYDELEGAQVVELDADGKEVHPSESSDGKEAEGKEKDKKDDTPDDRPTVDEQGRLLFRAPKKSAKRKLQDEIKAVIDAKETSSSSKASTKESDTSDNKKKKKKKPKAAGTMTLSFDVQDE